MGNSNRFRQRSLLVNFKSMRLEDSKNKNMNGEKKIKKILRVDKQTTSSLSAFVERPVPDENEVAGFEKALDREARNHEIDNNLSEIYSDKKGELINVQKMKVKRRQLFIIRFFKKLLFLTILAAFSYLAYSYFFSTGNSAGKVELVVSAPEKVRVGEEFSYSIEYYNPGKTSLSKVYLEVQYPDNFIINNFSSEPRNGDYGWSLKDVAPGEKGLVTITGQLINKIDSVNIITARLNYSSADYSAQFKKEESVSTILSDFGFKADLDYSQTAFIGQENEVNLIFSDMQESFLGDFQLSFSLPEETNVSLPPLNKEGEKESSSTLNITKSGGTSWQISNLRPELGRQEIPIVYKINTGIADPEIKVRLEKKMSDGQVYIFWEKAFKPELVKSDLNLTMFVNGVKSDSAVNFGQRLQYVLSYSNQGSTAFKDVVILASLKGDFLNFASLKMTIPGEVNNNTIIWTKKELPALEEIKPGQSGEIAFSIDLNDFKDSDFGKNLTVTSYAQYGVNNKETQGESNKSNTIINKINSDLSLSEEIRYFNQDNQPVGSGPLPPRSGEKTFFKVYWSVKNNLHELSDVRVTLDLPANVAWDERNSTNVGNIFYDSANNQMIWEIGRLPVSVYRADAEFGISILPSSGDINKILVLSPGAVISANDTETNSLMINKTSVKTTKLEDDDIAAMNNSGQVQP